jgi:catechol 2,3-dioxygenase-like lactoylglutathione lyase family enzyme
MNSLKVHHIGILVENVQATLDALRDQGVQCLHMENFPEAGMYIAFTEYLGKQLEFLEIISPDSPAASHKKGVHHLAFQVDNIHEFHKQLLEDNLFTVGAIRPGRHSEIFFFEINSFRGIQYECMQKTFTNAPKA